MTYVPINQELVTHETCEPFSCGPVTYGTCELCVISLINISSSLVDCQDTLVQIFRQTLWVTMAVAC